jgi:putative ABC transport system permease protein
MPFSACRRFFRRLSNAFRPNRAEPELARELSSHLALLEDEYRRRGLTPDAACLAARRALGGVEQIKDLHRDVRSFAWLDDLRRDLHYAIRALRRAPGFTGVAVLTLALGIGANTAIFSVVNAVLLRPLPYQDADRFVRIIDRIPPAPAGAGGPMRLPGVSVEELGRLRSRSRTLSNIGVYLQTSATLAGREEAVRLEGSRVSPQVFAMLGVQPMIGRRFANGEELAGADAVLILGYGTWQRQFGASPQVLGRSVTLDTRDYMVIGVMPQGFAFPDAQTQFWIPFVPPASGPAWQARFTPVARLSEGASIAAAVAEVNAILPSIPPAPPAPPPPGGQRGPRPLPPAPLAPQANDWSARREPASKPLLSNRAADPRFRIIGLQEQLVAPVKQALLILAGTVGFVLLIACVNVANLLLARTAVRGREIAVRRALGAGHGRLVRQLLAESILLALVGGLAGTAMAFGGVRLLQAAGASLPRRDLGTSFNIPRLAEIGIDSTVFGFALAISVATGILFGLAPALRQARGAHMPALRESTGGRSHRMQHVLVVAEIAMALVLLIGGGLLIHSFVNLLKTDAGYDPRNVLTFQVTLPRSSDAERAIFAENVTARLSSVPGLRVAGYSQHLPMVQMMSVAPLRTTPTLPAQPPPPPGPPGSRTPPEWPSTRFVSRDFFAVMGMRVIAGRGFDERDRKGQPQVMLISRALARSGLLGEDPIGKQVYALGMAPWEIVGIVDDVRYRGLDQEPEPQIFIDLRQWPAPGGPRYYAARVEGDPAALAPAIRSIVSQIEPRATLDNVATMEQIVASTMSRPRLYAVVVGVFAGVAVLLALVGIYGVMSYSVSQRTREIGIRMALGAHRQEVLRLVLGQSVLLTSAGLAAGLAGASLVTRYLDTLLFGLAPLDPATFAAAALLFGLVAILASYLPARRATRVDPLVALRCE